MKTVILCGGHGMRIRDVSELRPKPMIEIGGMPILWHIMKTYSQHGFNDFVLCLGYKGQTIKEYFYNYEMLSNDFTIELGAKNMEVFPRHNEKGWKVTLADTGLDAMTGSRLKKVRRYIDGDRFMLTYGDAVTNLDMNQLIGAHETHGKIGTVTGVCPPSRYGELMLEEERVVSFTEKPAEGGNLINGGYFVLEKKIFDYLDEGDGCVFEREPLERLASEGQLQVHHHTGFWQCMDTYRDYKYLNQLAESANPPWVTW